MNSAATEEARPTATALDDDFIYEHAGRDETAIADFFDSSLRERTILTQP